ncbi:MAG: hypothetical protein PHF21_05020 [Bacilli bacterium]|nr:hypothetical protein [Bacilli bacterium]
MNNKSSQEELKLLNFQIIISGAVVIIAILSLLIAYNLHLKLSNKKTFFNDEEVKNIALFIKLLAVLAALAAIYVSYKGVSLAKSKGEKTSTAYMEVAASVLAFVSSIIVIVSVYRNQSDTFLDILNPEL